MRRTRGSSATVEHDRIVHLLYDSAETADGLARALGEMASSLGAEKGHLLVLKDAVELVDHSFVGYDGAAFASYEAEWRERDPRFAVGAARVGLVSADTDHVDAAAFERSAIYNDFLRPVDVRYSLFTNTPVSGDLLAACALLRPSRDGAFGREEVDRFTALLPHLTRALRLRQLIGGLREAAADLRSVLDRIPAPLVLVDQVAKIVGANALADTMLRQRDGVSTVGGRLVAARASETAALANAIAQATTIANAGPRTPVREPPPPMVPLTRQGRRQAAAICLPLRPGTAFRGELPPQGRVLVVLHDPDRVARLNPATLAALHGLTATEGILAAHLAEGGSLADFATARGCSEHTARTHLKRLLDKTGTQRQADLVRVLLTSAVLQVRAE